MGSVDPLSGSLVPTPHFVPLSSWVLRMEGYYDALQNPPHPLWRELLAEGPKAWRRWVYKGLFQRIERPLVFFYRQRFRLLGKERERLGLWVGLNCRDVRPSVLPHEGTFEGGRQFYAHLYRFLGILPDPVHLLTPAPFEIFAELRNRLVRYPPLLRIRDNFHELHELWPVDATEFLQRLYQPPLVVADGHHRWEASLLLTQEGFLRLRPVVLTSVHDPGLLILPTHRLLKGSFPQKAWESLGEIFEIHQRDDLSALVPPPGELWWIQKGEIRILKLQAPYREDPRKLYPKPHSTAYSKLETALLHEVILPRLADAGHSLEVIGYERYSRRALERLNAGMVDHVVLLPPTHPQSVVEVARAGERMPQKSTDFYPKLVAGLVLTPL